MDIPTLFAATAVSDLDMYFGIADAALYSAKEKGRNRVEMESA